MLQVQGLCSGYGGHQILWDVSIGVEEGEVVTVMGPNGSGKSTLMNSISRLVGHMGGSIFFEDHPLHELPPHRLLALGISHVLERHRLFSHMSVLENLQLGAGPKASRQAIDRGLSCAYTLFPRLAERQEQMAGSMSGGEQQMCAIARGLMSNPRLLLVDEPFIGLSPHMREEVKAALQTISASGVAILMIEQDVKAALEMSHRAFVLREGRVVLADRSAALLEDDRVQHAFLGTSENHSAY